jgi:ankyrin repeat protein
MKFNIIDITNDNYYLNPYNYINKVVDFDDKYLIFKYIINNNNNKFKELLNNKYLDINIQDIDGDTPLHIALFLSNYDVCKILIKLKANLFIKDKFDQISLHRICFALNNKFIIKIIDLINNNQNKIYEKYFIKNYEYNIFNNVDKYNNTPLHLVIKFIINNNIIIDNNIITILNKLISLTNINIINNDNISIKDLINILN